MSIKSFVVDILRYGGEGERYEREVENDMFSINASYTSFRTCLAGLTSHPEQLSPIGHYIHSYVGSLEDIRGLELVQQLLTYLVCPQELELSAQDQAAEPPDAA